MRAFRWLADLFGKRDNRSEEERARDAKVAEGIGHFMEGNNHFNAGRDEEALDSFDRALGCGFEHPELFLTQAICLQKADYDFDAIEAFCKAIAAQPQDCNLYFLRSFSLSALCRYAEAADDLREAIRLSKADNARNAGYHAHAQERGYPSVTAVYEHYLLVNQIDLEGSDEVQEFRRARLQIKRRVPKQ
jgi:tetratricopeptide (TPR) repeat protein